MNFWEKLPRPFFILAPMHEVTDTAFRQIVCFYKKPDVLMTEFVSADGLCHPSSQKRIINYYLKFSQKERPIVAQIWGASPQVIFQASKIIASLGFDGIDINMGCPDKKVVKNGGGAALILKPKLARELILAAKEGGGGLPVSVKTRLGFNKNIVEKWVKELVKAKPVAITLHGRLQKENYQTPADWESIAKAAKIVKKEKIIIIGNGDVKDISDARKKAFQYGVDGVMIGRGVLGNPWFFDEKKYLILTKDKERMKREKLKIALKHALLFEKTFKEIKPFCHLRKHLAAYISDFAGAKEIRLKLMGAQNATEVKKIISFYLKR
ncbi:MAG: tRNA-dihydrouridine synthase [Candidatus Parcubacteria bacterium]|mgnify:CR=1 FL=1|nr:MAG: tRNA-dihydrouridine synthase [Candidatus Parcubacteria bacterium]